MYISISIPSIWLTCLCPTSPKSQICSYPHTSYHPVLCLNDLFHLSFYIFPQYWEDQHIWIKTSFLDEKSLQFSTIWILFSTVRGPSQISFAQRGSPSENGCEDGGGGTWPWECSHLIWSKTLGKYLVICSAPQNDFILPPWFQGYHSLLLIKWKVAGGRGWMWT